MNRFLLNLHNKIGDVMYYLKTFFVFSILGHFIENFFYTAKDSGILYGYWTPIYGMGVIITIALFNLINKKVKLNKISKFIITFFIGAIVLSFLEFLSGILIEKLLHITFWDYSNQKFNIGRYTSLKMSLIWGVSSLIIIYIIKPLIDKYIEKIPNIVIYILITLFAVDCIISLAPNLIK